MSVSIGYKPVDPENLTPISGGSTFLKIIEDEYGSDPILNDSCIGWLRGVQSCGHDGAGELIQAISTHGPIQLESRW